MKLTFIRINSNFTPHFQLDHERVKVGEKITKEIPEGILYYQLMEADGITFVRFGLDGHDQWWSSNSSTINKHFGINCIECTIVEPGEYPTTSFASAVMKDQIKLPDCLEWGLNWGSQAILPKKGIEFPRRKDYFMSTHLDSDGNLILPTKTS